MISSTSQSQPVTLGQPGQIQAPQDNIQQFQALLNSMGKAMGNGQHSFSKKEAGHPDTIPDATPGSLIQETAVSLDKAEHGLKQIQTEINKSTFDLQGKLALKSDFTQSIVYQKFTTASYFVNISRVGNRGADISEEIGSITKRR